MNKKIMISIAAITLLVGAGWYLKSNVYADDTQTRFPPLVQTLVDRFNLNEDEVSSLIDEQHEQMRAQRKADIEKRLNAAVSEGNLTEEQKTMLLQKMQEHQENMENMRDMTSEERRSYLDEHRDDMHSWAEENKIDLTQLNLGRFGFKMGGSRGSFGGDGPGMGGFGMHECIQNNQESN